MTSAAAPMRRDEIGVVLAAQAMAGKEEGIGAGDRGGAGGISTDWRHRQSSSSIQRGSAWPMIACGRKRAEVAAVEGTLGLPVHQEDFASRRRHGSPARRAASARDVTLERLTHRDAVDGDRAVRAADGLPGKGEDALQDRHAFGQIAALGEEARERLPAA